MITKFIIGIMLLTLFSCKSSPILKATELKEGTYVGHFIRSSPLAKYAPAKVTLTFKGGQFSGESDAVNYPAIGNGTFRIMGNEIEFTNERLWIADFDWSYILNGKIAFEIDGDKLEMIKSLGENTDRYSLELKAKDSNHKN